MKLKGKHLEERGQPTRAPEAAPDVSKEDVGVVNILGAHVEASESRGHSQSQFMRLFIDDATSLPAFLHPREANHPGTV